jgi:NADH:ubiquinone oxidoreductase subunit K
MTAVFRPHKTVDSWFGCLFIVVRVFMMATMVALIVFAATNDRTSEMILTVFGIMTAALAVIITLMVVIEKISRCCCENSSENTVLRV